MTIVTKPFTEKKVDTSGQPLVDNKINEARPMRKDVEANHVNLLPPQRYVMSTQRHGTATTLCLVLVALLVLTMGIISGVYIYRHLARSQMHRFRGWCSIPYDNDAFVMDEDLQGARRDSLLADSRLFKSVLQDIGRMVPNNAPSNPLMPNNFFKEEFEIDMDFEYETITVPDFRTGRPARFIHDFISNKTGIVDLDGRRCFVMSLNRDAVLPPQSLFDLISKLVEGYYAVNTETVRATMKVVLPPIVDYRQVGVHISRECRKMPTYMLEKVTVSVAKRSALEGATFGEFAGHNINEINVINMAAIEDYERSNPMQEITEHQITSLGCYSVT